MAIWEIRTWFVQCVRCRFRAHQEGTARKDFILMAHPVDM